tara:strand:- start:745 stop:930 length:186 start_codon:yes stop_codon:yes gene_type:complete
MDQIGKPIEVNRKFLKFIENDIQPEYERVLETLFQQLKEQLDKTYFHYQENDINNIKTSNT